MPVTVHLSGHLKPFSNGEVEVQLPGEFATVGDALNSLWQRHIALHDRVLNEQGEIRQHVNIFVGSDDVKRKALRLSSDPMRSTFSMRSVEDDS